MEIIIYSAPACTYCTLLKNHLNKEGIAYTEYDVMSDKEKAEEMVEISGQMNLPVMVVKRTKKDDEVIAGYQLIQLIKLLKNIKNNMKSDKTKEKKVEIKATMEEEEEEMENDSVGRILTGLVAVIVVGALIWSYTSTAYNGLISDIEKFAGNNNTQEEVIEVEEEETATSTEDVVYDRSAEFSFYNIGDVNQTDDTPCITASQDDGCYLVSRGIGVCASNVLPLHTIIEIESLGDCIILDRTAPKYAARIDYALPKDEKAKALEMGTPILNYRIK